MATKQSWFSRVFGWGKKQGVESSAALKDWSAGQVILDDFLVERELGAGGMGKVYLLRSRSTRQLFAVKRALLRNEDSRRNFLAELRTWIDLPEHPHLVACRFFRTVGDEVVIFAEFVERGSLETLIQKRQLTCLEEILDAAIQFAWGLHAAHEHGLVHRDVKPGNALMTAEGQVKVADFGLARARAQAEGQADGAAGKSILISCGGMTPAYCSPEQAQGRPLSRKTDIWSWGVAVLEMFIGEVTWRSGLAAPEVLKAYLKRPVGPGLLAMPNGVAEVLQMCFNGDPTRRWPSLTEAAQALQRTYRQAVGKDYPRPTPAAPDPTRRAAVARDRRVHGGGVQWDDPREWLVKALEADGRDPTEVEALLPLRAGSRKGPQAIADIAAYEDARRIFERLVAEGRKDLETQLATLCIEKALVHQSTDDVPGAVALYDRAISIRERLVEREGRRELANELAAAWANKANVVSGDHRAAVALYDRATAICEQLVEREGRRELANELARTYLNKANQVSGLGDERAAVALCDRAIAIYEQLVEREGRRELADELAAACMNKATVVGALGDHRAAVALCDRAIAIYERLVEREGRRELANEQAQTYLIKAVEMSDLGDKRTAVALYDQGIAVYELLVEREGRRELANVQAAAYMNKAKVLCDLGDPRAAVALYDRAISIRERLVEREGRRELTNELAAAWANKAKAVNALGDHRAAVALCDRAIAIYERLVEREGRRELADELARIYMNKALAVGTRGDKRAVALCDRAIAIYERLVEREGRRELTNELAAAFLSKAIVTSALGNKRAAVAVYDRAIAIYERLVEREGRRELADELARTYMLKAAAVNALGDHRAAVALCDRAIVIFERLVEREGRRELADELARIYMDKAAPVNALGDHRAADAVYDRAVAIYQQLVEGEGRRELADQLALAYRRKAWAVRNLGDHRAAVALCDRAIAIYERLVEQEGKELQGDLAWAVFGRFMAWQGLGDYQKARNDARKAVPILKVAMARTTASANLQEILDLMVKYSN